MQLKKTTFSKNQSLYVREKNEVNHSYSYLYVSIYAIPFETKQALLH